MRLRSDDGSKNEDDTKAAFEALGGDPEDPDSFINSTQLVDILMKDFKMTIDIEKMLEEIDEVSSSHPRTALERSSTTNSRSSSSRTLPATPRTQWRRSSSSLSVSSNFCKHMRMLVVRSAGQRSAGQSSHRTSGARTDPFLGVRVHGRRQTATRGSPSPMRSVL